MPKRVTRLLWAHQGTNPKGESERHISNCLRNSFPYQGFSGVSPYGVHIT